MKVLNRITRIKPWLIFGLWLGLSFGNWALAQTNICSVAGGTRTNNLFALDGTFGTAPAGTQDPTLTSSSNPTPTVQPTRYSMSTIPGITAGLDAQGRPVGTTTQVLNARTVVNHPGNYSPEDGDYEITNSTYNRQDGAWHRFIGGRNGGGNRDLFMFINAAFAAGVFYNQTLTVVPNSNYEFSISVINLIANNSGILPNVNLELDRQGIDDNNNGNVDEAGESQVIVLTGDIANSSTPVWREYGGIINTGATNRLTVRFRNNAAGGGGNDLAIDNLQFTTCTGLSTGNISGRLYLDSNTNNAFDTGEPGFGSNVAVSLIGKDQNLQDIVVATAQTAADGTYNFINVPAGTYTLGVPQNDPQLNAAIAQNPTATVTVNGVTYIARTNLTLSVGGNLTGQNFGFILPVIASKTANAASVNPITTSTATGAVITTATPGSSFIYTIQVRNNTSVNISNFVLIDALPSGLSYVANTAQAALGANPITFTALSGASSYPFGGSGRTMGRNSSFSNGNLNAGETLTIRFQVTVASTPPATILNQGQVTYTRSSVNRSVLTDDPAPSGLADPTPVTVGANLLVSKTASVTSTSPGSVFMYSITLTNNGAVATTSATLLDALPTGLSYVSNSAEAALGTSPSSFTSLSASSYPFATARNVGNNTGAGNFNNGILNVGQSLTIRFQVTVAATPTALGFATAVSNQATVNFNYSGGTAAFVFSDDPVIAGLADPTVTPVAYPDLSIFKSAVGSFFQGNDSSYTLTVSNALGAPASFGTVNVSDVLDSSLTFVSASGTGWSCGYTAVSRTVACNRSDALSGGSSYPAINLTVTPTSATSVPNTATVADGADNNSANNSSSVSVTVLATFTLSGNVFNDSNTNGIRDGSEIGIGGVTVALSGTATRSTVTNTSGNYSFSFVIPGSYTITETDLAGYISITPNTLSVSMGSANLPNQNFADFLGYRLSGTVFRDDGRNTGNANNALQDGDEPGISGITVSVTGTTTRTALTDASGNYSLFIPNGFGNFLLSHTQNPASGSNINGASVQLASAFGVSSARERSSGALANGSSYAGYNFGVVWASEFTPDQSGQTSSPGLIAYQHQYRPGTMGTVSLTAIGGLTYQVRRAANCTSFVATDALQAVPLSFVVNSSWPRDPDGRFSRCLIEVSVIVPAGRPGGSVDIAQIRNSLSWLNNASVNDIEGVIDTTTVLSSGGLRLDKVVRNVTQNNPAGASNYATNIGGRPGDTLEYCISFRNLGTGNLTNPVMTDPVPFFTNYSSGSLTLNGSTMSDAIDGDVGEYLNASNLVRVRLGSLSGSAFTLIPGASGRVCYRVTIR